MSPGRRAWAVVTLLAGLYLAIGAGFLRVCVRFRVPLTPALAWLAMLAIGRFSSPSDREAA